MGNIQLTGHKNGITSTIKSMLANLPELLGALSNSEKSIVVLAIFSDQRYVQFWSDGCGNVIGEVISNLNIGDSLALSPEAEKEIAELGFSEPIEYLNPNWTYEANDLKQLIRLFHMITLVITAVLKEELHNPVEIQTWEVDVPKDQSRDEFRAATRVYVEESDQTDE
jgi:hypothetical protein